MKFFVAVNTAITTRLDHLFQPWLLPTMARLVFASVLLLFFWNSGLTKLGSGIGGLVTPSVGAYAQIIPWRIEAVGYDVSRLGVLDYLVVLAGTYAEFILPAFIVAGFLTRISAVGMIGFIVVMTVVDIVGHGVDQGTVGALFDRDPGGLIADQRLLWVSLLVVLVVKGAGPVSIDRLVGLERPPE